MEDDECNDLRVFRGIDQFGFPCIISAWHPNKEDIEAIVNGEPIYLSVISSEMPPVSLQTENPFEK
jgi:hypothetical protein